MKKRRFTSALLLIAMLASLSSCGGEASGSSDTTLADGGTTTAAPETESYDYPDVDYEGYEFKVINLDEFYNCYMHLDIAEQTGETVDDAVFDRNRKVEEKLGIKITEIRETFLGWDDRTKPAKAFQLSLTTGDNLYDCGYISIASSVGLITDGFLADLKEIPEIQLDEAWWDNESNKALELGGKLYCATSPLQLSSLDLSWVYLFNKQKLTDLGLELPYSLVKSGDWTLDKLNEYATKTANLNGAESFTFKEGSNATYGIASHNTGVYMMLVGANNVLVSADKNGKLNYSGANERIYETLDKLSLLYAADTGKTIIGDQDLTAGNYYYMFANDLAAFITTELKGTQTMRPYDIDYGILPSPKLDSKQENYITYASENVFRLCVPVNAEDKARTGVILDALSFESAQTVLPLYYNQTISQKGLRDEESIEMLEIINKSRLTEPGMIYGITSSLITSLRDMVKSGGDTAASIFASAKDSVDAQIKKLEDSFN